MAKLNLKDLSKKIAIWLNNFREHGHPPVIDYNQVGYVDILLFWKVQLETIPCLSGPRGHWTEDERDAHFCRILFDVSYFQTLYKIWKKQLRASDLPYFTGRGEPLLDAEHRKIREYILERGGSPHYPSVDDLRKFANLLKGVRTVRFCEASFLHVNLKYCPCTAKKLSAAIRKGRLIRTLDLQERAEWCFSTADLFSAPPKCVLHRNYKAKKAFDDVDLITAESTKTLKRRRASSTSGDFDTREQIDKSAFRIPVGMASMLDEAMQRVSLHQGSWFKAVESVIKQV